MIFVITGTSRGLGFELAKVLSRHGRVIGLSRTIGKAITLSPTTFKWIKIDFASHYENICNVIEYNLVPEIGQSEFKVIVNSAMFYAGEKRPGPAVDLEMTKVNYLGPKILIEALIKLNLKRILFVNSVSGIVGQANQHEYASTKHALQGYASSLSKSAKNLTFDVMSINPGGMNTDLWGSYPKTDVSDFINPSVFAELVTALIMLNGRFFIDKMIVLPPSDL